MRYWTSHSNLSRSWHWRLQLGRVQTDLHVHRHSGHAPDRWVFQPSLIYDRKARSL